MKILAHRGLSASFPENTAIAFQQAAKLDCWGVEFDVHLTSDQQLVVIHDESIDRTSNGTGFVKDLTLAQLKTYDFGSWFDVKFAGQKICTLSEVLAIFKDTKHQINIEIKSDVFEYPGIELLIANALEAFQQKERIIISSFNHETIARFQQIQPQIHCALLFASLITNLDDYVRNFDCDAIHIPYYYGMRSIIQRAIQQGIVVRAYTVNKKEIAEQMEQPHIDTIFSDKGTL